MNHVDFCFWLQGYVELGGDAPNPKQWSMIKEHLALVFNKVTPTAWEDTKMEAQKVLQPDNLKQAEIEADKAAAKKAVDDVIKSMRRNDPIPKPIFTNLPYLPFDGLDKYTLTSHQDLSGRYSGLTPYC